MILSVLNLFFSTQLVFASGLTLEQKMSDFNQLNSAIESNYGPYFYKPQAIGLDYEELKKHYANEIALTKSNKDFYYLLVRYVAEYKDGHFGIRQPSNETYEIPITTDLVEGKVLIDTIDRAKLSEADFPFAKGDEIISINSEPIENLVNELAKYMVSGFDLTIKRKASWLVFYRPTRIVPAPMDDLVVSVRRGTSNIIENSKPLKWKKSGQSISEDFSTQTSFSKSGTKTQSHTNFNLLSTYDEDLELLGEKRLERSFQCSGGTRIAIPQDATMIINDPFVAYYHPTEKGNVGYLRIPHYYWLDDNNSNYASEVFSQYEYAISVLEKNTVGLIIDQDHNCGGSVDYLEDMISLFTQKPVLPMQFELLANKTTYIDYANDIQNWTTPHTILEEQVKKVQELIYNSWSKGHFLTPKTSISGKDWIYPHRIHYTKPIVMLIDELSGSGGDAFPSLMQGYGLAKLLGTRTSGLGGHVTQMPSLNYSAMEYRMTRSLFYRPDGVAVENNGAVPDVNYTITRDDFIYQYKNYQKFYIKTLLEMIP